MTTPIPQPAALPILGNIWNIDSENVIMSLRHLADTYGKVEMYSRLEKKELVAIMNNWKLLLHLSAIEAFL